MIFNSVKHLKDTIRNRENKFNLPPNTLINYYMMERFLCRINKSKYSYNFVIKGGFLLSSIIGIDMRSTMDIDATVKGIPVNSYTITNIIDEIIKVDLEDNIKFEIEKISTIHEEGYYENFRVTLIANFFNMKVPIKAYPILTILAEKIESIIVRNITSTRARDYYDVYILLKQNPDIDIDELKNATYKKAEERKTKDYLENTLKYFDYIKSSKELEELWKNFCKKKSYAKDISWEEIIGSLDNLFKTMNRSY